MRSAALLTTVILAVSGVQAIAVPVTFQFSGQVTGVIDFGGVLGGAVTVGQTFQGSYTYESTLPDTNMNPDPDSSIGYYASPASVMHVSIGSLDVWSGIHNAILVYNLPTGDRLRLQSWGFDSAGLQGVHMGVDLSDDSASVLTSDALPLPVPPISGFTTARFFLEGEQSDQNWYGFNGVIVPEPGSLLLALLGSLPAGRRRRMA